jgi:tetratricopeptide (TPR) repeat protein
MMLDRDKMSFWIRAFAIVLAAVFLLSGVLFSVGTGQLINPFTLFGNPDDQQPQGATTGVEEQVERARRQLEEEPDDPRSYTRLGNLHLQNGQTTEAIEVLEKGRREVPEDGRIPLYLGQAREQRAQALPEGEERNAAFREAGEAYEAATEAEPDESQAYLFAGMAYEQAGDEGRAIQSYNGYLDADPDGEQADAVRERITTLLESGAAEDTTGGGGEQAPERAEETAQP